MKRILFIIIALSALVSCSTTRLLPSGTYRLASNTVEIDGDNQVSAGSVAQYIRQQPNSYFVLGWNPFLNVYNWSDGSGRGINRIWEKIGVPPVQFDPSLVESSRANIIGYLTNLGYYGAKVDAEVQRVRRLAKVKYKVETGPRRIIDEIIYDIPDGEFADDFFADSTNMTIHVGDPLSERDLEAESVRGASYFRNLGYYNFNKNHYFFEADTLTDVTTLYYRIRGYTRNENESSDMPVLKHRFGRVDIHHPEEIPFRPSLLRKFNTIHPGDLYSESLVNTTYHRLSQLNVFNNVSIELAPSDSSTVDCDVRLSGSGVAGFKANFEASSNSSGLIGISPQLSVFHKNVFHGGELLNLSFTGNWQFDPGTDVRAVEYGTNLSLSFPKALGYPIRRAKGQNIPRTEVKASFNYQGRPEYTRNIAGVSYGYTGQIGSKLFYQVYPLQLSFVKLYDISDAFSKTLSENPYLWDSFEDHVDAGMGGMIYHTTDADIVPKTSYASARLSFDTAGNMLSLFNNSLGFDEEHGERMFFGVPYNQYVKAELALTKAFRFGSEGRNAIAVRMDVGLGKAFGNSTAMPFEKQFYCGGASSMRGWQVRTLGPGHSSLNDYFIIPSQTGDFKFETDLEYRFPMFWKMEGALFAEAGNVWNLKEVEKVDLTGIAGDWGLGLRINLDFILLRVDMGFKVHDPAQPEGQRWRTPDMWLARNGSAFHFGVGYPF